MWDPFGPTYEDKGVHVPRWHTAGGFREVYVAAAGPKRTFYSFKNVQEQADKTCKRWVLELLADIVDGTIALPEEDPTIIGHGIQEEWPKWAGTREYLVDPK